MFREPSWLSLVAVSRAFGTMSERAFLIIFDCDGVLIDSEAIASRVVASHLAELGWAMTSEEARSCFIGMSLAPMQELIETRLARPVPPAWTDTLVKKLILAMDEEAEPIEGARKVLEELNARGINWRVASNSADPEMHVKFTRTGLADLVAGRTHSAPRLAAQGGRPKPAPDVFLDAARAEKVDPGDCVVVEDSIPGITAAVAAGMTVYALSRHGPDDTLLDAGASRVLRRLDEVLDLLPVPFEAPA